MALEFIARFPEQIPPTLPVYSLEEPGVFPGSSATLSRVAQQLGLPGRPDEMTVAEDWTTHNEGLFRLSMHRLSGAVVGRHMERYGRRTDDPFALPDDAAEGVARAFVERVGLIPLSEVGRPTVTHLRTAGRSTDGGETLEELIDAGVVYGRLQDGIPVEGPGGNAMINIDSTGQVSGFRVVWRPVGERSGEVEILPAERAYEAIQQIAGRVRGDVRVTRATFGYFEQGVSDRQRFMQPAYFMVYVVEDGDVAFKSAEVVSATESVFEPILPPRRFAVAPQGLR